MMCALCGTENRDEALRCKGCGGTLQQKPSVQAPRVHARTQLEGATPAPLPPMASPGRKTEFASPDDHQNVEAQLRAGGAGKTTFRPPAGDSGAPSASVSTARIVGFLVSFTWDPAGQSFVIRDGKTIFGTGAGGVDHRLSGDTAMSGQHFAVMVRGGEVRIKDLDSTNATRVDDVEIWGDSRAALHGSTVRAGDSTFVVVLVPKAAEHTPPAPYRVRLEKA